MLTLLLLCCMTVPAFAVGITAYDGCYDNLADWPQLRIYADNLSFTDKQAAQYIANGTLEEEILKNVRSIVVFRGSGLTSEKGFLMIDTSAVKSEARPEGYEVLLYLTGDASQNYITITVFITGGAAPGAPIGHEPTQPETTVPETIDGSEAAAPDSSGAHIETDTQTAAPEDTQQQETIIEPPAPGAHQEEAAVNIEQIETGNTFLRCTLGLEILAGCASLAAYLPKIWAGAHILAWYRRRKKEVAKRSRAHAA